jgi:4,4'-diaponeurosporenoate glycosyltransferase
MSPELELVATGAALGAISALVVRVRLLQPCGPVDGPAGASVPSVSSVASVPPVSVVIPARDEAHAIGMLLADLRAEPRRPAEVIVVDDGSRDATAAVAAEAGAIVAPAGPTPPGWAPKVWALHRGASMASGDVLVFLDADVRLAPGAVDALVADLDRCGGVVSVAPQHRAAGPVEAASAAANVIAVAGGGPGLRRARRCAAVGSCIAVGRADYARIGGHAAHPATIVDDLDLAATARRHGLPVTLRRGGDLVGMRSYPDGLRAIVDGWSKNLAAGARRTPPEAGLAVGAWVTALVLPLATLARGRPVESVWLWLLVAVHTAWLTRRVGRFQPLVTSLGAPLLGLFTTFLTLRSTVLRLSGRDVTWKARRLAPDGAVADRPAVPG